jgi:hypothetical protein
MQLPSEGDSCAYFGRHLRPNTLEEGNDQN